MRRAAALPIALALALGLTACQKTLKTGQVEDTIAKDFKAQGIALHSISCHKAIKAKVGAPVDCTADNPSDTKLFIEGSVTKVSGSRADFRVRAVRGIAKGTVVAKTAQTVLERKVGQKAKGMKCPAQVPIPTTPSVTCKLTTLDGKVYPTTVTLDAQQHINVQVARQPTG